MELYIYNKKIWKNALYTQPLNMLETRVSYGDDFSATLHFPAGTLSAGDEILVAIDSDMFFGQNGTSPMAMQIKTITAEEAGSQTATFTLSTNTERFYTVVNGKQTPVLAYLGIYQHKATSTEDFPQIELALGTIGAMPVVGLFSDETTPVYPEKYYTKEETDALFVPNTKKGIANGVATLDNAGKIPREQIPEGGTIVIDNALSTTSQNPVQNKVITLAMQSKANLVNGKVPASELPTMDYVPTSEKGIANGVATLDSTGKVPSAELPTMDYVPTSEKGIANGVATLDNAGKVPATQLPSDIVNTIDSITVNGTPATITDKTVALIIPQPVPQVQADWDESDSTDVSYIQNKPAIPPAPIIGTTAPTTSTAGKVGQLYVNTSNSKTYHCTGDTSGSYTWTDDINANGGTFTGNITLAYGRSLALYPSTTAGNGCIVFRAGQCNNWWSVAGYSCKAFGGYTLAFGNAVEAHNSGAAFGKYSTTYNAVELALKVGIGTETSNRKDGLQLDWNGNLYISGGHQQEINTIPDATSTYTVAEGVYNHTPVTAPTYTLPTISDATRTHEIIIYVDFTNATSVAFEDANGTTISPLKPISISAGQKYCFLCQYIYGAWQIIPIDMGGNA